MNSDLAMLMNMVTRITAAALGLSSLAVGEVDFAKEVRPILNANCTACHGGVKEAGDVSFIYRDKVLGKGESGKPTVVPGDPDASEMMVRILSDDPDMVMPKPEHGPALPDHEIEIIRQWIKEGAKWGEHWSFVPPKMSEPPSVHDEEWSINDIDRFILARLESENIKPSPRAEPAELLRRVTFDLTGLPPSLDALDRFIADPSQESYEAEVDRLLASPAYGERWTSVWLDQARYADSEGWGQDKVRTSWKYRDWVIDAFNEDLPFDQFTIDQMAGDLVADSSLDQKIATHFHRLTQSNQEGGTDDEEFRVDAVLNRVNTTWAVWQGLTMECVQCHAHPYDPIQADEFYTSVAFFNQNADADMDRAYPLLTIPLDKAEYPKANELQESIRANEKKLHELRSGIDERTSWQPVKITKAESKKAELKIQEKYGHWEYLADANAAQGAVYDLELEPSQSLQTITAIRLEYLPLNEEEARHTPEWGAVLKKIEFELIGQGEKSNKLKIAEVIADEAHPFSDPNDSITGKGRVMGGGWGAFTKIFHPRHCTIVLEEPVSLSEGDKLKVRMTNGGMYLASFPLVSKRGRFMMTDQLEWITHRSEAQARDALAEIKSDRKELADIKSVKQGMLRERDPRFARETRMFIRGNWLDKGELIEKPDTPKVFAPLNPEDPENPTRLDFARWLTASNNPLTARVAVNRFWMNLFGVGFVPTPEDFGSAGEPPTHPALFDTLSVRFREEMDWSMKALIREMVTSATYQQSGNHRQDLEEIDPANYLRARGPRQRLSAEMVRDHALSVSNLITEKVGDGLAYPPIPKGAWQPFQASDKWKTPEVGDPERYRRAVYTLWKLDSPNPAMIAFDAPRRQLCSARRIISNTPIQALTVLNDPASVECARALGKRIQEVFEGSREEKLATAYRAVTSRKITPERLAGLMKLYDNIYKEYIDNPGVLKETGQSAEEATYFVIGSVLMNLDESLTR